MGRKKKSLITEMDDDSAIELVKCWLLFKDELTNFFNNITGSSVELAFESSLDESTHYHFDTDEAVFISDFFISFDGHIRFEAPYGSRFKSFTLQEAELIRIDTKSYSTTLDVVIAEKYNSIFKDTKLKTIEDFVLTMKQKEVKVIEMFNDAKHFLDKFELERERSERYSKLPNYGLF